MDKWATPQGVTLTRVQPRDHCAAPMNGFLAIFGICREIIS